jgi:ATP-dependent exoDNAse (exonuclease V) beta subunit
VTVVSASAGTGKTYDLTHRYVRLLLAPEVPHGDPASILAITFTNNAAAEMRQRILEILKGVALGLPEMLASVSALVSLPEDELRRRAASSLERILHRFGEFQVRTIDSFMQRVLTAAAPDLGIRSDFTVVLSGDDLLARACAQLERSARPGTPSAVLLETLTDRLDDGKSDDQAFLWDPFAHLAERVSALRRRLLKTSADLLPGPDTADVDAGARELTALAREIATVLESADLPVNAHYRREIDRAAAGDWAAALALTPKERALKSTGKKRPEADPLFARCEADRERYNAVAGRLAETVARSRLTPYVRLLDEMTDRIERVRAESGERSVDEVNRVLARYLEAGNVPAVFFRLGDRVFHYLIDEFQDTSPVQWHALSPLLEEAVAKEGSLYVVGDTKQAIYGWRGADWRIMRGMVTKETGFASVATSVRELEVNRRSDERVADFVHRLFTGAVASSEEGTAAEASGLTDFRVVVPPARRGKGHVEVFLLREDEEDQAERECFLEILRSALARGYRARDIAVLLRTNEEVVRVSGWLSAAGIPAVSFSSMDIRSRSVVGEILALLRFLDTPVDDLSLASFLLGTIFTRAVPDVPPDAVRGLLLSRRVQEQVPLYILFRREFPGPWNTHFDALLTRTGHLPLYDLLCAILKTFRVFAALPEDHGALAKLLEVVKDAESTGQNSLKSFLDAAETDADNEGTWGLPVVGQTDAVTLMTIHKAKGLQFPVVIAVLHDRTWSPDNELVAEGEDGARLLYVTTELARRSTNLEALLAVARTKAHAEELNGLYVALTRAEHELYVLARERKRVPRLPSALIGALPRPEDPRPPAAVLPRVEESATPAVYAEGTTERGTRDEGKIGLAETARGEAIHDVLSRIEFLDGDPAEAVDAALPAGDAMTLAAARPVLISFLAHPAVTPYFARRPGRRVLREQDIVGPDGALFRIDRLLVDPEAITVLDFKTGKESAGDEYRIQVSRYADLVRDAFGVQTVRGVLLYVDLRKEVIVL